MECLSVCDGLGAEPCGNDTFEQGVAGETVGSVQPCAGSFAQGVELRKGGSAAGVGLDAAAGVVLHGADGDGLARHVQATLGQAVPMDGRKMPADERCGLMSDVERDEVLRLLGDFDGDGAGNDVARCEFGAAVVMRHKPFARLVGQDAAFAAHGFGNQEGAAVFRRPCQACGVELDKFEVFDCAACAYRHGNGVARAFGRRGGGGVNLS